MRTIVTGVTFILSLGAALFWLALQAGLDPGAPAIPARAAEARTPGQVARFEPSSPAVIGAMLSIAGITKNDVVYDLGCGDGRIVIAAARSMGARGVGVDLDPRRVAESRKNAEKADVSGLVQFVHADLFEADISRASVIMLYLTPDGNLKLRPRLLKELKPGTRIVSHSHSMGDWLPDRESKIDNETVYLWVVPAGVSGIWKMDVMDKYAGSDSSIEIRQSFQNVEISVKSGATIFPVTGPGLSGSTIRFTVNGQFGSLGPVADFSGQAEGDTIRGTFRSGTREGSWTATRVR